MKKTLLTIFVSLCAGTTVFAADSGVRLISYDISDGLSGNTVNCFVQDGTGYIWVGTRNGLDRFDGCRFHHCSIGEGASPRLSVTSVCDAGGGTLWVGTESGLYHFDPATEKSHKFLTGTEYDITIDAKVNDILVRDDGLVWIATDGQGIFIHNPADGSLRQFSRDISNVATLAGYSDTEVIAGLVTGKLLTMTSDGTVTGSLLAADSDEERRNATINVSCLLDGYFYVGLEMGDLMRLEQGENLANQALERISSFQCITDIITYNDHSLLLGTGNGLFVYSPPDGICEAVYDKTNPKSVFSHFVNCIFRDREGGIWVGTRNMGIYFIPRPLKQFESHLSRESCEVENGVVTKAFCQSPDGRIWIGTAEEGVFVVEPGSRIPHRLTGEIKHILCLSYENGTLYIGTESGGLYLYNTRNGSVKNYRYDRFNRESISDNHVNVIFRRRDGRYYIGTEWGLNIFNPRNEKFHIESADPGKMDISDILEDSGGSIWVSTHDGRFFLKSNADNSWIPHQNSSDHSWFGRINCLFEDYMSNIWLGTESGLVRYDRSTRTIGPVTLTWPAGASRSVSAIEQDSQGNLWFSGYSGIMCLNIKTLQLENIYDDIDGIQSCMFEEGSSIRTSDGSLCFGSNEGYNIFRPDEFSENLYSAATSIGEVLVNGRLLSAGEILRGKTLKLNYKDNTLTFNYSILSFQAPVKNRCSRMLEGWDEAWSPYAYESSVTYGNLPSGRYVFRVKGENNDGVPGTCESEVAFIIRPPWYSSWFAIILYALLATLLICFYYAWHRKRKEDQAFQSKIQFYTNFAHEVRNPITLIKAPITQMLQHETLDDDDRKSLIAMDRNADNLLDLVNQLLDYRKTEASDQPLKFSRQDAGLCVRDICTRFSAAAEKEGKTMDSSSVPTGCYYEIDSSALSKIIGNLLSNATKYAERNIEVSMVSYADEFRVVVTNDGPMIPEAERQKIFEMFYQTEGARPGTGIGLALARMLAQKHGGSLDLLPVETGASFCLIIKAQKKGAPNNLAISKVEGKQQLLIVDDNIDLRNLVTEFLKADFNMLQADNGLEALAVLGRESVDLILSDVVMPEMDGYELCRNTRQDKRFAGIPFLFLTGKVSSDEKVKGLECGADGYIEKPFTPEYLMSKIRNVLETRTSLKHIYSGLPIISPGALSSMSRDDMDFLNRFTSIVENNLANDNFYIENVADVMCISQSSLYRKIRSLLDISPNEYIKKVRLHKGAELLSRGNLSVMDVYTMVGFNTSSYFAACFKKEFGCTPAQYINSSRAADKS
ncbi:MAG: response regulator [Bacteroidales bacterium]|nr:response regulator [Bacteroidales bacterium]